MQVAPNHVGRNLPIFRNLNVWNLQSSRHSIDQVENCLQGLAKFDMESNTAGDMTDFFRNSKINETAMGTKILEELHHSWDHVHQLKRVCLAENMSTTIKSMTDCLEIVGLERPRLENFLLKIMKFVPATTNIVCNESAQYTTNASLSTVSWHVVAFRLKRTINRTPIPTIRDIARISWAPEMLKDFNPFLSESAAKKFHNGVFEWLELCVLENKLHRMLALAAKDERQALKRELEEIRHKWCVKEFPQWLVFEMEQQLQIRQVQVEVAKHLMKNPGAIAQLNMGKGKTRVILPMIILHLGQPNNPSVLRLHILSFLLHEAYR